MSARQTTPERTPKRIAAFRDAFFSRGNLIRADCDPDSPEGRYLQPLLQVLYEVTDVPVVLPRRRPEQSGRLLAYVIALNPAHATTVSELLTAFVGPSYSYFDGRTARLEPNDPVDRAVLDFVGVGSTFVLSSPIPDKNGAVWGALRLLQETMRRRPVRPWQVPKPVGRLLAEFEAALAAGDHSASAQTFEQLRSSGGMTALNVANLRIKRLARLGRDHDLLDLPDLPDVVTAVPPVPVTDAILTALYTTTVAEPLTAGDLPTARRRLIEQGSVVPALMRQPVDGLGACALTVLATAAWVRNDADLAQQLVGDPGWRREIEQNAPTLVEALLALQEPAGTDTAQPAHTPAAVATSWPELIAAVANGDERVRNALDNEHWRDWSAPAADDATLAAALRRLDDTGAERAWSIIGAFLDADGYQQPAAQSAAELIQNALAHSRFGPADLAALVALTEITLRAGPGQAAYGELLDDLRSECNRWVGPERATVALDLADLLVRSACPDAEARLRLAVALLKPLHAHLGRLDADQRAFAAQLSDEMRTGLDWPRPAEDTSPAVEFTHATQRVLLYSLDVGALTRAATALGALAPKARIRVSDERVGSPQLRQHARNADLIVLATRCATHAAIGFIRTSATAAATITEADGSGSASLLRAAVAGLRSCTAAHQPDARPMRPRGVGS